MVDQAIGYKKKSASQLHRDHNRAMAHMSRLDGIRSSACGDNDSVVRDNDGVTTRSMTRGSFHERTSVTIESVRSQPDLPNDSNIVISDIVDSPVPSNTPLSAGAPEFVPCEMSITPSALSTDSIVTEQSHVDHVSLHSVPALDISEMSCETISVTSIDSDIDTDVETMSDEISNCPCNKCLYGSNTHAEDSCEVHYKCTKCSDGCMATLFGHCYMHNGHVRHRKYLMQIDAKD